MMHQRLAYYLVQATLLVANRLAYVSSFPAISNTRVAIRPPNSVRLRQTSSDSSSQSAAGGFDFDFDDESSSSSSSSPSDADAHRAEDRPPAPPPPISHIRSIRSSNLAGAVGDNNDGDGEEEEEGSSSSSDVHIDFGTDACLVAVTGESGSGKSLLVSKAIDLVTGGKFVSSLVPTTTRMTVGESSSGDERESSSSSSVELTVDLREPHLTAVSDNLQRFGIRPSVLLDENPGEERHRDDTVADGRRLLRLERTLIVGSTDTGRSKSVCRINGKHVSLKTLREISSPLFVRVDVGVASSALGRMASRLAVLDAGVEQEGVGRRCVRSRDAYREARGRTEGIRRELESRVLPSSFRRNDGGGAGFDEEQMELLDHWVEELDSFERRISAFQKAVLEQYNESRGSESDPGSGGGIAETLRKMHGTTWGGGTHDSDDPSSDDDSLFAHLTDFREEMRTTEARLASAHAAYESLASLSAPHSALAALESTRKILYGIGSGGGDEGGPLFDALERTHELLNGAEASLADCARSLDGGSDSLTSTLEKFAFAGIPMEEVDGIIGDWNALARKHGISAYSLPNCHVSLRQELDGNVEALQLLPEAEEDERMALKEYSRACRELSDARKKTASKLSESVTNLLPSLGLEGSAFQVELSLRHGGFDEPYCGSETIGVDVADFLLLHRKGSDGASDYSSSGDAHSARRGGKIEQVGSSGEKSRVLLACETALPGSIGATCNSFANGAENASGQSGSEISPISIVYDEIDAHVGGRAAVTMARLLADQSNRPSADSRPTSRKGKQIIAITHSASLAAIADRHIVVERGTNVGSSSLPIRTYVADGPDRRKEIARMASGDLASGEAETFADALIRDAVLQRETSTS